ncbi:hypothetical protein, partial [Xanthomonas sp. MUS 060]|uniref:hypothetical protein n=1 Tax=Xanthomonas sp. MUS 060 TaxID=1588031 RepID=UPI001F4730BD
MDLRQVQSADVLEIGVPRERDVELEQQDGDVTGQVQASECGEQEQGQGGCEAGLHSHSDDPLFNPLWWFAPSGLQRG